MVASHVVPVQLPQAIDNHIAARRADKDFQKRLKKRLKEDREVLERLAK